MGLGIMTRMTMVHCALPHRPIEPIDQRRKDSKMYVIYKCKWSTVLSAEGNFGIKSFGLSGSGQIPFGCKIRRGFSPVLPFGLRSNSCPSALVWTTRSRLLQTPFPRCPANWLQLCSVSGRLRRKTGGLEEGRRQAPFSLSLTFLTCTMESQYNIYSTQFLWELIEISHAKCLVQYLIYIISIQRVELLVLLPLLSKWQKIQWSISDIC